MVFWNIFLFVRTQHIKWRNCYGKDIWKRCSCYPWIQEKCNKRTRKWGDVSFVREEFRASCPHPSVSFQPRNFHYPIARDDLLACEVHVLRVDTQYSCEICGVLMCPVFEGTTQSLSTFLVMQIESRRLSEGRGRSRAGEGRGNNAAYSRLI